MHSQQYMFNKGKLFKVSGDFWPRGLMQFEQARQIGKVIHEQET